MKNNNLFPIAKEGWKYLGCVLALFILFFVLDLEFLGFVSFFVALVIIYFFRNPERELPIFDELSFMAPSDGVVKSIVELEDSPYAYRVDVEGSLFDVAVLRAPMHSQIESIVKFHGTRVAKSSKLFKDTNENMVLLFKDAHGNSVKVSHRLKQSFFPLFADVIKAQNVQQTSRYGFMSNGVTSIYLPRNFRLNVQVGNQLKAAESLMGYFS